MNHMITDDPGTSSYSPLYRGEQDEEKTYCFLCEKETPTNKLRSVRSKQVCTDCIDYEGIQAIKDIIIKIELKENRNEIKRLNQIKH